MYTEQGTLVVALLSLSGGVWVFVKQEMAVFRNTPFTVFKIMGTVCPNFEDDIMFLSSKYQLNLSLLAGKEETENY